MANLHFLLLLVFLAFYSCNSGASEESKFTATHFSDSVQKKVVHELGAVRLNIEQSARFHSSQYGRNVLFREELLTQPFVPGETSYAEALAFGALASDFVYCVSYKQTQHAIKYLDVIIEIARRMGLEGAFDSEELALLYSEDPTVNKSAILTKAYLKASEQLYSEERAVLVTHMVVGGWARGLRIATAFASEDSDDYVVKLGIYDKCYSYYSCQRLIETVNFHPETKRLKQILDKADATISEVIKGRGELTPDMLANIRKSIGDILLDLGLEQNT